MAQSNIKEKSKPPYLLGILCIMFIIDFSSAYAQKVTYNELGRNWYSKFSTEVAPLSLDTIILLPQTPDYMVGGYYYSVFKHHKKNIFYNLDVNTLIHGISDPSSIVVEKWILKGNNIKIRILRKGYLKSKHSLYYRYVPIYDDQHHLKQLILIKER